MRRSILKAALASKDLTESEPSVELHFCGDFHGSEFLAITDSARQYHKIAALFFNRRFSAFPNKDYE
jgi:hypothetical protein